MLQFLMRISGGMIKTSQQAEMVLYIISAVLFIISAVLLVKTFMPQTSTIPADQTGVYLDS